jgi:hypothetical protein
MDVAGHRDAGVDGERFRHTKLRELIEEVAVVVVAEVDRTPVDAA